MWLGCEEGGQRAQKEVRKAGGQTFGALQATVRSLDFRSDGEEWGEGKRANKGHL